MNLRLRRVSVKEALNASPETWFIMLKNGGDDMGCAKPAILEYQEPLDPDEWIAEWKPVTVEKEPTE